MGVLTIPILALHLELFSRTPLWSLNSCESSKPASGPSVEKKPIRLLHSYGSADLNSECLGIGFVANVVVGFHKKLIPTQG